MRTLMLTLLALGAGCLPLTVSVAPDGRVAIAREEGVFVVEPTRAQAKLVHRSAANEEPASAVFSPDGARLLICVKRDKRWRVEVRPLDGGDPIVLYDREIPVAHAGFSPNGKQAAIVLAPAFATPTLLVLEIGEKAPALELERAAPRLAWSRDGALLYAIKLISRDADSGVVQAQLLEVKLADGSSRPLARLALRRHADLSVGKDGRLAIVALGVNGNPDQLATPIDSDLRPDRPHSYLFLREKGGRVSPHVSGLHPTLAAFDPAGGRLLVDDQLPDGQRLMLITPGAGEPQVQELARGVATSTADAVAAAQLLPAWLPDGQAIYCWRYRATLGRRGRSLRLQRLAIGAPPERRLNDIEGTFERAISAALRN